MNVFRSMDELLRKQNAVTEHPYALLVGAVACYALYGVAAGFFQGGWSLALAVMKVPLIILGSLLLCIPSLYVFAGLAGADLSPRAFANALAGFAGITGLILLALMPVTWLFSVSTLALGFVVFLHLFVWLIALSFGGQFLGRAAAAARGAVVVWLALLFIVSLQMTTYVRPVLWRSAREPLFATEKLSFFGHLGEVFDWKPPAKATSPSPVAAAVPAPPR